MFQIDIIDKNGFYRHSFSWLHVPQKNWFVLLLPVWLPPSHHPFYIFLGTLLQPNRPLKEISLLHPLGGGGGTIFKAKYIKSKPNSPRSAELPNTVQKSTLCVWANTLQNKKKSRPGHSGHLISEPLQRHRLYQRLTLPDQLLAQRYTAAYRTRLRYRGWTLRMI